MWKICFVCSLFNIICLFISFSLHLIWSYFSFIAFLFLLLFLAVYISFHFFHLICSFSIKLFHLFSLSDFIFLFLPIFLLSLSTAFLYYLCLFLSLFLFSFLTRSLFFSVNFLFSLLSLSCSNPFSPNHIPSLSSFFFVSFFIQLFHFSPLSTSFLVNSLFSLFLSFQLPFNQIFSQCQLPFLSHLFLHSCSLSLNSSLSNYFIFLY